MKKTTLAAVTSFCLLFSQTAMADIPSVVSKPADEVVTLGEYKGIELTKEIAPVTDEDIESMIEQNVAITKEDAGDGPVEEGQIAKIDYEGKKDGVAFEGGTAEGYELEIGSGTFIPGFEDGVIGMMKGETKDIELTFPEEYQNEDLAGQDVVFTVTVQSISRTPEFSEDWVKNNTDAESVDAYREQIKAELEADADTAATLDLRNQAFQAIMEGCEFGEIPEEDIQFGVDYEKQSMESMAAYYGMELKDMLEAMGYTEESFEEECHEYGENQAKVFYILQAILDKEGIVITDEEAEEVMADYIEQYGFETLDELKEAVGGDQVDRAVVTEKALQFIIDNAVITEKVLDPAAALAEVEAEEAEAETEEAAAETEEAAEETAETEDTAAEETEEETAAEDTAAGEAPAEETAAEETAAEESTEKPAE
ncbi:MAG: trigger factor [Blautia sp.]|nr:trigger factor [Blautia sp.]